MWAEVRDASEFQMSGPRVGRLVVSTGHKEPLVCTSIVWSEDSRSLAFLRLFPDTPEFRSIVLDALSGKTRYAAGRFGPLTLLKFAGGSLRVRGTDGFEQEVDLSRIAWS